MNRAPASIRIRQANFDDATHLSELVVTNAKHFLAPYYSTEQMAVFLSYYSVERVRANLNTQQIFCAERTGKLVGTVGLNGSLVVGFYTHVDYQRQGIGQALMAHLHAHASACGIERLELYASPAATSFYLKIGYSQLSVQHVLYSGLAFEESHMQINLG